MSDDYSSERSICEMITAGLKARPTSKLRLSAGSMPYPRVLVERVAALYREGGVDAVVHNDGTLEVGPLEPTLLEKAQRMVIEMLKRGQDSLNRKDT